MDPDHELRQVVNGEARGKKNKHRYLGKSKYEYYLPVPVAQELVP